MQKYFASKYGAMRQLAREGRPNGGRTYGYEPAIGADGRRTRKIIPAEAAVIRQAAERLLVGETLTAIARELDADGAPQCRAGKGWSATHIRSIVTNPTVAGMRPDPDGRLITAIWDPILDLTTWRRVNASLAAPAILLRRDGTLYRTERRRRQSRQHLLTGGLAVCGVCGAPLRTNLQTRPSGEKFAVYECDPRWGQVCVGIVAHRLEPVVTEAVFALSESPAALELLAGPDDPQSIEALDELETIETELSRLASEWASGRLHRGEWEVARRGLSERADQRRDQLARATVPVMCDPANLRAEWDDLTIAGKRAVLFALIDRIEVHRAARTPIDLDRVRIVWRPPLDEIARATFGCSRLQTVRQKITESCAPRTQREIAAQVVRLYEYGLSMATVGRRLGLSASGVARILEARGVARRSSKFRFVPERRRIVELYAQGLSVAQIVERVASGRNRVARVLREEGVFRAYGVRLPWTQIIEEYVGGASTVEIATRLGVSTSGVRHVLMANQVPRRRPGRHEGSPLSAAQYLAADVAPPTG